MKINHLVINQYTLESEKFFYDLENKIQESNVLDITIEVELIQFGKNSFSDKLKENSKIANKNRYFDENGNIFFLISGHLYSNQQVEEGNVVSFNENNQKIWSGEIVDGVRVNGKGFFDWKDKENYIWKCEGKNQILISKINNGFL